jgi:murein DD-endopeptidase MepM/ murein hydrolase activator NlpD
VPAKPDPRTPLERAGRLALGILLLLALPSPAGGGASLQLEAWARRSIATWRARYHYSERVVNTDALVEAALRRSEALGSSAGLDRWLAEELQRASLAFAPRGAVPDPAARYGLPFDPLVPRVLGQGNGGTYSHTGREFYSFDFVMPVGSQVRAAREGVVAEVIDGFTKGGGDLALLPFANVVRVLHADGTFADYVHLQAGIPVKEGERVKRGQVLARSGQTGYAAAPHLHFAVARVDPDGLNAQSIPIRFGRPGGAGFVPKEGEYVGFPPKPNLQLILYADDQPAPTGQMVKAHSGQDIRIRVDARRAGGPPRDVTRHPRLRLVSMTPWNLTVTGPGAVSLRPMQDFSEEWGLRLDVATVGVFFLNRAEREIGLGKVEFWLEDRKIDGPPP